VTRVAGPPTDSPTDSPTAPAGRSRRRLWVGALVLVLVVAAAGFVLARRLAGDDAAQESVLVGRPAPVLAGTTLDGQPFDLAGWRGSVVLVNLWGSWCAPCQQELPVLVSAYDALQPRGLKLVGVDVKDGAVQARDFLARQGASWPSVADPDSAHAVDWGAFGLPETYLVDRNGRVVAKSVGVVTPSWIDDHVVPLLARADR
jgi:cytochrome c biogenesis protein CcmG/thiol:disulfide interchange protein DsbE